jgi:hypothetical protein
LRSLKKWCKSKNIPIIKIGLKKYILSHYLTQYIDNQIVTFVEANSLSDLQNLSEKNKMNNSILLSDGAKRFLKNIKSNLK